MIALRESAALAEALIAETVAKQAIALGTLTLHIQGQCPTPTQAAYCRLDQPTQEGTRLKNQFRVAIGSVRNI